MYIFFLIIKVGIDADVLVISRPGVAGAVLQTPLSFINSLIQWLRDPFPPNLQNNFTPKRKMGTAE